MDTVRSVEEIRQNLIGILPDWETCRVIRYVYDENLENGEAFLALTIRTTKDIERLVFSGVHLNGDPISALRDAMGLYIIDTSFLGWDKSQKIEVGDWDGGPPLFWAEKVEKA